MIASQVDPLIGTQNSYSLGSVHSAPVSALKLLPQECAIRVCVCVFVPCRRLHTAGNWHSGMLKSGRAMMS